MSDSTTIAKNTLVLFAGELIAHSLGFFITIILARHLGDAGFGIYSFAFAFTSILLIFSDVGISTLMVRDASRNPKLLKKYASNIFVIKLLLSAATLAVIFIAINITGTSKEAIYAVYLASVAMIFLEFSFFFRKFFNVLQILEYEAMTKIIEKIVTLSVLLLFVWKGLGLLWIVCVFLIAYAVTWIVATYFAARKVSSLDFKLVELTFWKYLFKNSWQFWLASVFAIIYFRIDTVMLSYMSSYEAVGWYNAAYKLLDGLNFIPTLFIVAIFPAMSFLYVKNKQYLQLVFEKSIHYLLALAIPIGIGISLLADRIILVFYSAEYTNAILALQILIWAEVFVFVNYFIGFLLNSIDKQKLFTITTFIGLGLNVALNLFFIPIYGIYGAAAATLATEILIFVMLYIFSRNNGFSFNVLRAVYKPIVASLIMGAVIFAAASLHVALIIPVAAGVYFVVLYLIKGVGKDELALFVKAIAKLRKKP